MVKFFQQLSGLRTSFYSYVEQPVREHRAQSGICVWVKSILLPNRPYENGLVICQLVNANYNPSWVVE
jgi:hypothetical protein